MIGKKNTDKALEILDDLKKSIEITNSNDAFCFPFYAQDERTRNLVKEAGFKVAFIGGNRRSTRNDNKMLEPRYPIKANITLEEFIRIVTMWYNLSEVIRWKH